MKDVSHLEVDLQKDEKRYGVMPSGDLLPTVDVRSEVMRRRAQAIAEADARGEPRRPMDQLLREHEQIDIARLQGRI